FERENEYTLAGSIYKGRVTRVLPGMQSAFVDIGLERDAFLYVSDFFELPEDQEGEFDEISVPRQQQVIEAPSAPPPPQAEPAEPAQPIEAVEQQFVAHEETEEAEPEQRSERPPKSQQDNGRGWKGRRRRRGRRGRGLPESKFAQARPEPSAPPARESAPPSNYQPIILPGESISKYQHLTRAHETAVTTAEPHVQPSEEAATPNADAGFSATRHEHEWRHESRQEPAPEPQHESSAAAADLVAPAAEEHDFADHEENFNRRAAFEESTETPEAHRAEASHHDITGYTEQRESQDQQPFGSSFGAGRLEEEEIEEEETDLPAIGEEFDDDQFEELEEETQVAGDFNDRAAAAHNLAASGESEAAAGAAAAEAAAREFESEDEDEPEEGEQEQTEHEEYEFSGEGEEDDEPLFAVTEQHSEDEGNGRAELRAPSGTAGYQQRAARPDFDRRRGGRGRRAGRRFRRREAPRQQPMITDLLKEGQEVLIQIAKEPIGKKGARITSHIALPGRFLVYMPTVNHTGVSRKIASDEERQRLKRIVMSERENGHGGFIVRTAAQHAPEDELRADIRFLKNLWNEIKSRAENSKAPALIYHDLNLVERILRDQVTQDFSQIWVDTEQEYERILRFASRFQPGLVKRVKLYTKETPLFEQFNLQEEINKALKSKVWLKSGGYIVINQTEALVAIDVNTGKYVGKTQRLEDTIVKTNVDAIKEIVRQIRLRDLGGIIVIDFIDMDERRNRQKVMQALEEALRADRAPSKVLQFNDFGLVAITRKRVKQSMERTLGSPCPYCTGTGMVKSVNTVCNEIYTEMRKLSKHLERPDVLLRVHPEVAKALKGNSARWLQDLEELTGRTVIVKSDPAVHQEQFDIN
ncbi:MAG TPA: Rne/Rng family ribonuclease, partial [Terriglobales bacterium]|nr:Rne/Rng family ribonuclease [Terriglobales bacterium]